MGAPAVSSQADSGLAGNRGRFVRRWISELGPLLALVLVFAGFALAESAMSGRSVFTSSDNIRTMLVNSSVVGICASA